MSSDTLPVQGEFEFSQIAPNSDRHSVIIHTIR